MAELLFSTPCCPPSQHVENVCVWVPCSLQAKRHIMDQKTWFVGNITRYVAHVRVKVKDVEPLSRSAPVDVMQSL